MEPSVLDPVQLERIQGTHRGFLYQHLYAASCFLLASRSGVRRIRFERDEDVELVRSDSVVYVQIKTRSAKLVPSDLKGVLERFDSLREAHQRGERGGSPFFAIVTNAELGPTLAAHQWPSDVVIAAPSTQADALAPYGLPVPPAGLPALAAAACELAEAYRHSVLRADSLVAKLVGLIATASAAAGQDNELLSSDLPRICELVATQIRPLPVTPSRYRPQINEPTLTGCARALVVEGHGGDGKTAWAAHAAALTSDIAVYVPCSDAPGELVAPRVVDAVVASVVARGFIRAHDVVHAGRSGTDALSHLDRELLRRGIQVLIIVDDCHRQSASQLLDALRAAPGARWILLGRPSRTLSEVVTLESLNTVRLGGWDDDTVAELLSESNCSAHPTHVAALRRITGGAPLFVLHGAHAISAAGGDTAKYAEQLAAGTTPGSSAQEAVLRTTIDALDLVAKRIASAMVGAQVSLTMNEWAQQIAGSLSLGEAATLRAIRDLIEYRVAFTTRNDRVGIYDSFYALVDERFLDASELKRVRERILNVLRNQLLGERARERIVAFVRIAAALGRLSELTDVANAVSEWIRETGVIAEVRGHLEAAVDGNVLSPEDQFWALDTLVFFDIEDGAVDRAAGRLPRMRETIGGSDISAAGALSHKEALVAWRRGDIQALRKAVRDCPPDKRYQRMLRYQGALGEADAGELDTAVAQLEDVADGYLQDLGLTRQMLFGANPPELLARLRAESDAADARHLADCFDAMHRITKGRSAPDRAAIYPLWAMKLYAITGAERSALRAGQLVADMMLDVWGDALAARSLMEKTLLPGAKQLGNPDITYPLRAQYAVICAEAGDYASADREMRLLAPYAASLSPSGALEIQESREKIDRLRTQARPRIQPADERALVDEMVRRMKGARQSAGMPSPVRQGRNDPCACGSGLKYKKCCGRPL